MNSSIMETISIVGIAIGLAMDAFAVSIVSGSIFKEMRIRYAVRMALFFGAFQALMPLMGYVTGQTFACYIGAYDHWVAFGLLAGIGGKMVYEAFQIKEVEKKKLKDPSNLAVLLVLSVATSIDALAVGVTISLVTQYIYAAVAAIGIITFALSYTGYELGRRIGHFFEIKIEFLGGLILIGIGLKILISHLFFNDAV